MLEAGNIYVKDRMLHSVIWRISKLFMIISLVINMGTWCLYLIFINDFANQQKQINEVKRLMTGASGVSSNKSF